MKIFVKGIGEVIIDPSKDFIAKGGEGSIYGKGNTVYKIYEDQQKMIPVAKMQELSVLTQPNIIKPEHLVLDSKNKPIGYTMKWVKDTNALCRIFTKSYKINNKITNDMVLDIVKKFQQMISYIHSKNILVVDLNEFNFLVDQHVSQLYAIDVNSYQTPNFPATAIMPSVHDLNSGNNFSELTDWFSWGVVSCQILLGVHPYRHGGYKPLDHLPLDQRMEGRMKQNISIFNSAVKLPPVAQPFSILPSALKAWFIAVFEKGERVKPPSDYTLAVIITTQNNVIIGGNNLEIEEIDSFKDQIVKCFFYEGKRIILTTNQVLMQNSIQSFHKSAHFCFTQKYYKPIAVWVENNKLNIFDLQNKNNLDIDLVCDNIMSSGGRIYIKAGSDVLELIIKELSDNLIPVTKKVGRIMENASMMLDGCVLQNMLGSCVISIFPESGQCHQIKLNELDGFKIIEGKYENKVFVVICVKHGKYTRFVFRFASNFETYDCRKVEDIIYTGINFTVNDANICVLLNEEEKLEVFSTSLTTSTIKIIEDKSLSDFKLTHDGAKIVFHKDNKLYTLSMKKKNNP